MKPPNSAIITLNMIERIIKAGIEAMTHLIMNITIDVKLILMSVTTTSWRFSIEPLHDMQLIFLS